MEFSQTWQEPLLFKLLSLFVIYLFWIYAMYNWLVVWNMFYFSIHWEYPNWLIFFRGGEITNQIIKFGRMNHGVIVGIVSLNPLAPRHPVGMSTRIVVVRGKLDAVLGSAVLVSNCVYIYILYIFYIILYYIMLYCIIL